MTYTKTQFLINVKDLINSLKDILEAHFEQQLISSNEPFSISTSTAFLQYYDEVHDSVNALKNNYQPYQIYNFLKELLYHFQSFYDAIYKIDPEKNWLNDIYYNFYEYDALIYKNIISEDKYMCALAKYIYMKFIKLVIEDKV